MQTIPQKVDDIHDDSPWPEAPETMRTPRQVWCATDQAIADRAKATLPESGGRIDAAVKMVLAGDVELLPDGSARVQSQSNGQTRYWLVHGTCPCRDYEHAPSHLCKHTIAAGIAKRVYPHLFRHQLITYLTKQGIISPKLQLLSGHTAEQSLAVYRDLALADVAGEYEEAMKTFPIR